MKQGQTTEQFLAGNSEIASLMRTGLINAENHVGSSSSSLGKAEAWSPSLKSALSILLNACCPMFVIWGQERNLFYNDAFLSILKENNLTMELGDSVNKSWVQQWSQILRDVEQVFLTEQPLRREELVFSLDGQENSSQPYTLSYGPLWDETGQMSGVFATGCPKISSEPSTAHRDEKFLEAVLRQMPEGVIIADAATKKLILANEQTHKILRYEDQLNVDLSEDEPKTPFKAYRLDGRAYAVDEYPLERSLFKGEVITHEEMELRYPDGSRIIIEVNSAPIFDNQDKITSAVVVFQDITKRKQAEMDLSQSEARFRHIFECNMVPMGIWTRAGGIVQSNDALLNLIGYTRSELEAGRVNWLKLTPPEWLPLDELAMVEMATRGFSTPFEKEYIHQHGHRIPILMGGASFLDDPNTGVFFALDLSARQQIEAALRDSEEFKQSILDSSSDCIKVLTLEGEILYINTGGLSIIEAEEPTAILNANWVSFWQGEAQQSAKEVIAQAKDGKIGRFQGYCPTFKGKPKWWDIIVTPLRDGCGQVVKLVVISRDITEQKRAEEALRESMAILNTVNRATPTLIYVKNRQGQLLMANQATVHAIGQPESNLVGQTVKDFLKPDEARQIFLNDLYVIETGEVQVFEETVTLPEGTHTFLSTKSPYRDEQGNITGLIGVSTDITERKQAELERERLLARERHYINQLQGLTTAALTINSALSVEQMLQVITEQAASIIGTHQSVTSMTIDQNWSQAITAVFLADKYAAWRNYDQQPDGSGIYACVCHLNRPMRMTQAELEAHPKWRGFGQQAQNHPPMRGWLAAPLQGRDGKNMGLIQLSDKYEGEFSEADEAILVQLAQMASVAVENARLYEAEQQARATAEALREQAQVANRIKDEFLAVLSHELRSPLNPILGWSSLLRNTKLDEVTTKQAIATIERNALLQAKLIEDLLDVSRILRGKLSLTIAAINLAAVINAAIETVRLAAQAKSIKIETRLEPEVGLVLGDSTRLQQVVWNLLSNAVKFTPSGGIVQVFLEEIDHHAQITVSDTGKGIKAEFLPYVFDYFRQADSATTRKFGGLGLGLAIVRHLVELHGGTISVQSPGEGKGATFTVIIPIKVIGGASPQNPVEVDKNLNLSDVTVLVVDDDLDTRDFLSFLLKQAGATVITSACATEAFTRLTQSPPDIVVSDIGMPEIDGYQLMRQIRALSSQLGGKIKAIALSAYAQEFDQQQALLAGFDQHLSKPVNPASLIAAIAELLN